MSCFFASFAYCARGLRVDWHTGGATEPALSTGDPGSSGCARSEIGAGSPVEEEAAVDEERGA